MSSSSETTHVSRANASAVPRAKRVGRMAMTMAPSSGRKMMIERIGTDPMSIGQFPDSAKYAPAITMNPMAMPRA